MNTKTIVLLISSLTFVLIFSQSCKRDSISEKELLIIKNTLIGSWHSYDYKFSTEDWSDFTEEHSPYVILAEYGSGFDLDENQYFTHYSESLPTGGDFRGNWELVDENTLEFTSSGKDDSPIRVFEVKIIEIEDNFLSISENDVEYKLIKIE